MIAQKFVKVEVLVFLLIFAHVSFSTSSSKSKLKSTKGKRSSSSSSTSSSQRQRSGHQYAPLMLRPSKPDPHFEILDEQRAYYNFGRRLREGRDSSNERKPTKLKEQATTPAPPSNNVFNPVTSFSRKGNKERSKSLPSSDESTFMRKSTEGEDSKHSRFSGSQLISGDGGPMSHSRRVEQVEKDGWKILMGPSVAPEESVEKNYNEQEIKRSFTSLTDGVAKHRKITKLRPVKKAKSISTTSNKYFDINDIPSSKKVSKFIDANSSTKDSSPPSSTRKGSSTSSSSSSTPSRRIMQMHIPKQTLRHKYATVTKRVPNKNSSVFIERMNSNNNNNNNNKERKTQQQQQPSPRPSPKLTRPSQLIKSSLETRYASLELEQDDMSDRMSPVMTLDTKKLKIEPTGSAEPTTLSKFSSMSTEQFSVEQVPTAPAASPSTSYMESRYDPIPMHTHMDNLSPEVVDGNPDDEHNDYFQTKTALHSAEFPLISLSASMNYPVDRQNTDQGGIITASSFSNQNQHVENSFKHKHFPEFSPMPHTPASHLAELQEPDVNNALFEDTDTMLHSAAPLTSPHVEFVGIGSKAPLPPPLHHGPVGASRLPPLLHNTNGRLKITYPPPRSRFPLELPPHHTDHFQGSLVPSENLAVTADWYPHFSVGSSGHPTIHPESLPIMPEPGSSNNHAVVHGGVPAHHHLVTHPTPHHHLHYHHPHYHHRPPPLRRPPLPFGPPLRHHAISPLDAGSGRKAPPPGDFVIEIGPGKVFPHQHNPPPPPGVDPNHPAVQHALRNPHTLLNDGIYIEPTDSTNIQETTKKYLHNLHYQVHQNTLIPLDKRLVYLSMIFSWMFWLTTFYTYYRWHLTGNKAKQIVLNVPKDGDNPLVTTRALDTSSPWNFTKVLEYIEVAQKTYEGFDWQDLDCQKRTLCELVQKQNDPWGETGRKLANSYVYRFMDALDGIPIPQVIQSYLKQYKEAISQGKNTTKDCGAIYSQCKFSIKEVLNKASNKKKA